jgi:hypothetical protein
MLTVLLLACLAGVTFGLARFQAWALVPIVFLSSLVVAILGFRLDLGLVRTALAVVAANALVEFAYLIGAVLSAESPKQHQLPDRLPANRETLRTIRIAIADELRVYSRRPMTCRSNCALKLAILEAR